MGGCLLRLAIPNKGRLYEPSVAMLEKAGMSLIGAGRMLVCRTCDPEVSVLFVRAEDIPRYVEVGSADLGITGKDLIEERGAKVAVLSELDYGKCRVVLAAPKGSAKVIKGKRIATKLPNLTRKYLRKKGVSAQIIEVSGATEIAPYMGIADMIVDQAETGLTLETNSLEIVDEIMASNACLIANKRSIVAKKDQIMEIKLAFDGIMSAKRKKYLMANVTSRAILEKAVKVIPAMESPTVLQLAKEGEYAVHAVVDERDLGKIIRRLKEVGAKDILVLGMERVIP